MLSGVGQGNHVLHGVHVGATWRTRFNRPCAPTMRPYVILLGPVVMYTTIKTVYKGVGDGSGRGWLGVADTRLV